MSDKKPHPLEDPSLSDREKAEFLHSSGGHVYLPDDTVPDWVVNAPGQDDPRRFVALMSDGSGISRLYTNFEGDAVGTRLTIAMLVSAATGLAKNLHKHEGPNEPS